MESLNKLKGYGKVEVDHHLEDQQPPPPPHAKTSKPFIFVMSIFALLFLTLTIAFTLAAFIHHTNTESPEAPNSTESIRAICSVTRFPNSCFSTISSSINTTFLPTDPEAILKLSLQISLNELTKLASSLKTMASSSNGPAMADCKEQIDDALSRLNDSLSVMAVVPGGGGKTLTDAKISDIQTWVSAAVTDQQTCLDGLQEMESVAIGEVKSKMQRSSEYTSNSLAIVANIRTLLQQFHMPLH